MYLLYKVMCISLIGECNHRYIKDIIEQKKLVSYLKIIFQRHIKESESKVRQFPIIKQSAERIFILQMKYNIQKYLPDLRTKYPSRPWFWTVGICSQILFSRVNALIQNEFSKFIVAQIQEREIAIITNKCLKIKVSKEFANLFEHSKIWSHIVF